MLMITSMDRKNIFTINSFLIIFKPTLIWISELIVDEVIYQPWLTMLTSDLKRYIKSNLNQKRIHVWRERMFWIPPFSNIDLWPSTRSSGQSTRSIAFSMYSTWPSHDRLVGHFSKRTWSDPRACIAFHKAFDGTCEFKRN